MSRLPNGGSIASIAWGRMMRRMASADDMFSARPSPPLGPWHVHDGGAHDLGAVRAGVEADDDYGGDIGLELDPNRREHEVGEEELDER